MLFYPFARRRQGLNNKIFFVYPGRRKKKGPRSGELQRVDGKDRTVLTSRRLKTRNAQFSSERRTAEANIQKPLFPLQLHHMKNNIIPADVPQHQVTAAEPVIKTSVRNIA